LFIATALVFTNSFVFGEISQKDFVFDKGYLTQIHGNCIWAYLIHFRYQKKTVPGFKHIRVIKLTKDKKFKEIGTLGSLEKGSVFVLKKFEKHSIVSNAIYCDDVEEVEDYDGNLHSIGAIVYRTRDLKYCSLVREFVKQQKQLAEKNKAAESAAPATASVQK